MVRISLSTAPTPIAIFHSVQSIEFRHKRLRARCWHLADVQRWTPPEIRARLRFLDAICLAAHNREIARGVL